MSLFHSKTTKSDKDLSKTNILESDGYIILDHISNGSNGEVRHAKYIQDNELNLAVKIIDTRQTNKDYVSKCLPRELDIIVRQINHPYIKYTHSILQKKAELFVFMEFSERDILISVI